jgi:hypothetical protein
MCVLCGERQTADGRAYCAKCSFVVRVEIEDGMRRLADYLDSWAAFDEWCAGRPAPG